MEEEEEYSSSSSSRRVDPTPNYHWCRWLATCGASASATEARGRGFPVKGSLHRGTPPPGWSEQSASEWAPPNAAAAHVVPPSASIGSAATALRLNSCGKLLCGLTRETHQNATAVCLLCIQHSNLGSTRPALQGAALPFTRERETERKAVDIRCALLFAILVLVEGSGVRCSVVW